MEQPLRDNLAGYFARHAQDVAAVYIFGSHARGTATATSDVDVAILLKATPPRTLGGLHLDLAADIEHLLGCEVDLVVLNTAPVDLVHRVLRDGALIADFDPSRRIQFEVKARNEYFDLAIYIDQYRRYTERRS